METKKLIEIVKKMREEMGLSLMDIKSAVVEAGGDEKKAKEILKAKGLKSADKRAEKETSQGRVATYTHSTGKVGVMVELLCETDFVAKNEEYLALTKELCLQVAAMNPESPEDLLKQEFVKDPSQTIENMIKALSSKFGENIRLGRICRFEI